jgi:hypothetical protein
LYVRNRVLRCNNHAAATVTLWYAGSRFNRTPLLLLAVIKIFMMVQQGLELSGADLTDAQERGDELDDDRAYDSAYDSAPNPRRPKGY